MSKGSTPIKVLRTALKRVDKGWIQSAWVLVKDDIAYVCLEGALFGYCDSRKHGMTQAQELARDVVLRVIKERYPGYDDIPTFNDSEGRTKEEVQEVIKLAIIRLEMGGDLEDGMDEEDFDNLLEFMNQQ